MKDNLCICIAGKNNIAIRVLEHVLDTYPNLNVIACCNSNDGGKNGFQRSYRAFCDLKGIQIVDLNFLYKIENLIFLSLEFDKLIKPSKFTSNLLYNIHFSFLPEYKGMYTSALPILHGELYSGVTFHKIDEGIDTGEIIDQTKFELSDSLTAEELYKNYILHGTRLVLQCLENILLSNVSSSPQSAYKSSYYSKKSIDYSNLNIDVHKTAFQIKCQINAFSFPSYQLPIILGTKAYGASILEEKSTLPAGTIVKSEKFFIEVATIDYNLRIFKDLREELFRSAELGDLKSLIEFQESNYDIRQRSNEGWDIAIIAAFNGQFNYLTYVLEHLNWDLETANNNGTTLLMYVMTCASRTNNIEFLEFFLSKYCCDIHVKDYFDKDVFYYANKYKNEQVINLLKLRR